MSKNIRYTVLLTPLLDQTLTKLQTGFGKRTRADVIDLAITLLDWAYDEKCARRAVGSMDSGTDTFREILFPIAGIGRAPQSETPSLKTSSDNKPTKQGKGTKGAPSLVAV